MSVPPENSVLSKSATTSFSVADILANISTPCIAQPSEQQEVRLKAYQLWNPPVFTNNVKAAVGKPAKTYKKRAKGRRIRTIFTRDQLEVLEEIFNDQQYMVGAERLRLADQLGLTETQVGSYTYIIS